MSHKPALELLKESLPSVDDNRLKEIALESASKAASFMPLTQANHGNAFDAVREIREIRIEIKKRVGMEETLDEMRRTVKPLLMAISEIGI